MTIAVNCKVQGAGADLGQAARAGHTAVEGAGGADAAHRQGVARADQHIAARGFGEAGNDVRAAIDELGPVAGFNLKNLAEKDVPYLRRKLGIVFQDFQLLSDRTIEQNLEFVLKATGWNDKNLINERIKDVLEKVGLRSKIKKMPHEISGGEQQRVVIARALLNNPEIILADEPTGNLDPETSEEIVLLLKQISQSGTAVLMATHDYHIIRTFPSRIIKCEGGVVHEDAQII